MRLTVNGKEIDLAREMTIVELLHEKGLQAKLVAVEHNLSWLRREYWSTVTLRDGDRLEIVHIMAGG